MEPFAWMKRSAADEPSASSTSVAVVEPPEPVAAERPAGPDPSFVYNPWKMKELRRLYVNLQDGTALGYLDLVSLAVVPESEAHAGLLHRAVAGLTPGAAGQQPPPVQTLPRQESVGQPKAAALPWEDLARNRPGMLIEDRDDASYRAGVAGEQRTTGVLAGLERDGYRVLHSIPLSPRKDIDHLVVGPTGIHGINTKTST